MVDYQLTASDIMQIEVATVLGDVSVEEAVSIMRYEGVRSLIVLPRDGLPAQPKQYGIVTYSDVVGKVLAEGLDPRKVLIDDIAIMGAVSIPPRMTVQDIARLFRERGIGHAPVVDEAGELRGVLSTTDLVTEVITETR